MKLIRHWVSAIGMAGALTLCACTSMHPPESAGAYPTSGNVYSGYGVLQSIEMVRQDGSGISVGTLAGAVVGGIVGSQVGQGQGQTAATVIGAAGGAYAGHELEKQRQQQRSDAYKFTIRMNDGSYQTVIQASNPDIRVGDRVRVTNGVVQRY